jgi:hypothetical protein
MDEDILTTALLLLRVVDDAAERGETADETTLGEIHEFLVEQSEAGR